MEDRNAGVDNARLENSGPYSLRELNRSYSFRRTLAKPCLLSCSLMDTHSIPQTISAHAEQKRARPLGTNATPSRGTSRQTSHISVAGDVADVDVDVDVADATSSSVPSSLFGCEISSESTCVTRWLATRRNCIRRLEWSV